MSLPRVIVDGPLSPDLEAMLHGQVEVLPWLAPGTDYDDTIEGVYTYGHPTVDGPLMDRLPGLRVISNNGVGVDHIDLEAAKQRRIPVGNTPGAVDGATADMAIALVLAAGRRIVESDQMARAADFEQQRPQLLMAHEVHGKTIGIVGLGRIGRQVAKRAAGFEMRILYHNRHEKAGDDTGAIYVSLDQLLAESDFVVLTVPLTATTRGMIGSREIALMKSTAVLVNVARGPIVDTAALTQALQERRIRGAGLDVTDPEPLPRDHPLLRQSNVVITPHLGSATYETRQKMAELSIENLLAGLRGDDLTHQVG
ncbi:2-hydroxyacid dehydrogenase [Allorhodopirellula solitaria]|uniref:Glyoxylate/hydroxypyruvate reductase B n=1 Tax=Allorhodopirellula solitaria TaxID=2527987 RepID=A0A5C5WY15_9BACT|nr:D-glycerate dehydrogenase [Allorhodopirellula solitaria]TWT55498.1 Glyoxylate/hydroxypyruvate reductase B [Allorhodopirellula solitaria]